MEDSKSVEHSDQHDAWQAALDGLQAWHDRRDQAAGESAISFLEVELRRRVPAAARRRWPEEQLHDALQGFLARLVERPLPPTIKSHPQAYLTTSFRHWCIDIERGRQRHAAEPWEDNDQTVTAEPAPEVRERVERVTQALDALPVEDRVVLKMTDAPELLTWLELDWLARRSASSADDVRARVLRCPPVYELTLIFDPGPEPGDAKGRRDRMERFRKRRERARSRLRAALKEEA
jgi:DNA-directed RNA polymerase specialized sigma24 family protein